MRVVHLVHCTAASAKRWETLTASETTATAAAAAITIGRAAAAHGPVQVVDCVFVCAGCAKQGREQRNLHAWRSRKQRGKRVPA